jgi:hypothetical protein
VIVLVCGSRTWTDRETIWRRLRRLAVDDPDLEIIHGGAGGADSIAGEWAILAEIPVRVFPADWCRLGRRAGFVRNVEMLDEHPDLVVAFQRGGSPGTQHTIDEARRRGISVEVVTT